MRFSACKGFKKSIVCVILSFVRSYLGTVDFFFSTFFLLTLLVSFTFLGVFNWYSCQKCVFKGWSWRTCHFSIRTKKRHQLIFKCLLLSDGRRQRNRKRRQRWRFFFLFFSSIKFVCQTVFEFSKKEEGVRFMKMFNQKPPFRLHQSFRRRSTIDKNNKQIIFYCTDYQWHQQLRTNQRKRNRKRNVLQGASFPWDGFQNGNLKVFITFNECGSAVVRVKPMIMHSLSLSSFEA